MRRVYLLKENGKLRPLHVPALEDRLVQSAATKVLSAIYEQDFLDCSYGYRAGRSAHNAVAELTYELQFGPYPEQPATTMDNRGTLAKLNTDRCLMQ